MKTVSRLRSLPSFIVRRHVMAGSVMVFLLVTAGGCAPRSGTRSTSLDAVDLRERSTISLRHDQRTLALFARGTTNSLDGAQERRIEEFARAYRAEGRGPMSINVPRLSDGKAPRPTGLLVVLGTYGVAAPSIKVSSYVPQGGLAPAIQLSYQTVDAVASCPDFQVGPFERDPGAGSLGCSYAAAVARTVADPLDLVERRRVDLTATRPSIASRAPTPQTTAPAGQ